jgi:hypothetical protein
MVHGFLIGTDRREPWMLALDATCLVLVGLAVAWRVQRGSASAPGTGSPVGARAAGPGARRLTGSRS